MARHLRAGGHAPAGNPTVPGEVAKAVQAPRLNQYITDSGHAPGGSTPEEFRKFLVKYLKDTAEQLRIAKVEPQ